jgi:hypothetical protein
MGLRVIVVPLINFCSNSKDQVVDSIIIKHLAVEATPTSEVEGMREGRGEEKGGGRG